jgi:prepilin-type processing-associated H-X9-DG protein
MPHFRRLLAAAVLMAFTAVSIPAADPPMPPDLALVPADAAGFVHVRVADLYKSEHFREFRQVLSKAGDDALKAFNSRFVPAPNTVDRVTLFFFAPAGGGRVEPAVVAVITTSAPFDRDRLVKSLIEGNAKQDGNVFADERGTVAVNIPGDHLFALGSPDSVRKLAIRPRAANEGPLAPALALAAGGKPFVAAINAAVLPAEALQHAPPQMQPFVPLLRAKLVTLVADFDKGTHLDLRLKYADAQAADDAEAAAKTGRSMVLQFLDQGRMETRKKLTDPSLPNPGAIDQLPEAAAALLSLAAINQADEILRKLPLRKDGADLRLDVTLPPGPATMVAAGSAVSVGLLLPAVQKVREAANRAKDQNNLKQIALAMHNYHDAMGALPRHAIYSEDGKTPLLSWRVAILPYIDEGNLYKQFKLDEPWDSPNNKPLIARMPMIYAMPNTPPAKEPGLTYYQVFVGKGAAWERQPRGQRLTDFTDGTSNTLMVVEAADAVTWTKPDDLAFDPEKPLPKVGGHFPGGFNAAFMDGSVRFFRSTLDPVVLKALITRDGGEVIDYKEFDK